MPAETITAEDPWLAPIGTTPSIPRPATRVTVFKVHLAFGQPFLEPFPNIIPITVTEQIGVVPASAKLMYRFDDYDATWDYPSHVEHAFAPDKRSHFRLDHGDRIIIAMQEPGGGISEIDIIFDGNIIGEEFVLIDKSEVLSLNAVSRAAHEWDTPMPGALMAASTQSNFHTLDRPTDVKAVANPKGQPNATLTANWKEHMDKKYPLFIQTGAIDAQLWTAYSLILHILQENNPQQEYVRHPPTIELINATNARIPIDNVKFDPADPATFTEEFIIPQDIILTGRAWPSVINEMLIDKGIVCYFKTTNEAGQPVTRMHLKRTQEQPFKRFHLQLPHRDPLDLRASNIEEAHIATDRSDIATSIEVLGDYKTVEATYILCPAFNFVAADATEPNLKKYLLTNPDHAALFHDTFRTWIFAEDWTPYYVNEPAPALQANGGVPAARLEQAFSPEPGDGQNPFVFRSRKPLPRLLSRAPASDDDVDNPTRQLTPRLSISTDYAPGTIHPHLWDSFDTDPPQHWQPIHGGWELLKNQIGIRVNCDDPNMWHIGKSTEADAPYPDGVVKIVESLCTPTDVNKFFYLRLTVAIELDERVRFTSRNTASREITRTVDAPDRYKYEYIHPHSEMNPASDDPKIIRNDTDAMEAEATARRFSRQDGILGGTIVVPYLTRYYELGDRIGWIKGRDIDFATNPHTEGDHVPSYPIISTIRYHFTPEQRTTFILSDENEKRATYMRNRSRPNVRA